ncbi:XRN 5'-3' exonuclease N-terminus-domain-containing protein [Limtongia smithiae]|uniref:XRN 5'-3' exonuclease N-terminus-domain-containing protein n=1 Tax=Limtongia smithiae TaxID=1125753 RepID=UPI0034CF55D8
MGVPALFRWLSRKYPKIVTPVIEEPDVEIDGFTYPADYLRPNPNGELDNLYLDMNGIVHPCSHPEGRPPPASEDEMMLEVFKYTDRVVSMARPRKVLMIAVDGVAPRAKMNQQRSRRFRAAREAKDKDEQNARMMEEMEAVGKVIDDSIKEKKSWDTNVITPGTPFMGKLAVSLRYWIAYKLNTEPGWRDLEVIISDASVPGEGEHKIMEFIRSQRQSPYHDANTSHAIYGLDADLIMLGLATHEPFFRVLREDVFFQERGPRHCHICGQPGHIAANCTGQRKQLEAPQTISEEVGNQKKPFIWLHVNILRDYLQQELFVSRLPFKFDLERAIDDWVFMCFFVGNDFLPHIPSLEIRENGIDTLINIWRRGLANMGGYLTTDGHVNLKSTEYLLRGLGMQEDQIFRRRREREVRQNSSQKRRRLENGNSMGDGSSSYSSPTPSNGVLPVVKRGQVDIGPRNLPTDIPLFTPQGVAVGMGSGGSPNGMKLGANVRNVSSMAAKAVVNNANAANKSAASYLRAQLFAKQQHPSNADDGDDDSAQSTTTATTAPTEFTPNSFGGKRKAGDSDASTPADMDEDSTAEDDDGVRLWEPGYNARYYAQKFKVRSSQEQESVRRDIVESYVEGVSWVLLYYYQGCPSWTWFYPYHYAPFASDFTNISGIIVKFTKGAPFRPYEQLMGVLPAASSHTLPEPLRELMTKEDSVIADFYPEDFPIDMNGKKMAWQGVALLPFIDEARLLTAVGERYHLLTDAERKRNSHGNEVLYISGASKLGASVLRRAYNRAHTSVDTEEVVTIPLHPKVSNGLIGFVQPVEEFTQGGVIPFPLAPEPDTFASRALVKELLRYTDIQRDSSVVVYYVMPPVRFVNKSMLLPGYVAPPKVVLR